MQEDKRILNDSIILVKNLSHSKLNKNELLNLLKIPIKNIKVAFFKYVHLRFN